MDLSILQTVINRSWEENILPTLQEYITIPNKSPHFDPQWEANGHMEKAVNLLANWAKNQDIPGMTVEIVKDPGKTPIILIDISGQNDAPILLYGHLDKQPEMMGWEAGLGPWQPVMRGEKLYGRGAADDGYAIFAALTAVISLQKQNIPHSRCVILIEASEESGSIDLPYYINRLKEKLKHPSLVVCLDSGCGNYDQLWLTTSLRGLISGTLTVKVLSEGVHSGVGSGIIPSPIRILRQLLNRLEDVNTGKVIVEALYVDIPQERLQQTNETAEILKEAVFYDLPFLNHVEADPKTPDEALLNRAWKPALSITGIEGIPCIKDAGNVTLPAVSVKLSMRIPPTLSAKKGALKIKEILEKSPPNNVHIEYKMDDVGSGWHAPQEAAWLTQAIDEASRTFFGKEAAHLGEGGSIPFMGMLSQEFPHAQFCITGVLGPKANAHGPNEFLHIPTAKKLTACIAYIIAKCK